MSQRAARAVLQSRAQSTQLWWQLAGGACVLAYVASLLFVARPKSGYTTLWDGWVGTLTPALPLVPVLLRIRHRSALRRAWAAIAAGIALNTIGNVVFLLHDQNLNPFPVPAWSDLPFLLSYVAFMAGIVMMTQSAFGRGHASVRLDGAVAGLALGAGAVFLWFGPLLNVSGRPWQVAIGMAYPLCDLVLLVLLVAGLAPQRYRPSWPTGLLMLGAGWFVLGDIVFLQQTAANTYVGGTPLEGTWAIGIFLMGVAAWTPERRRAPVGAEQPRPSADPAPVGIALVPVVSAAVSLLVLAASAFDHASPVAAAMAIAALSIVIGRMAMTVREIRQASENFREARTDFLTGLTNRRAFLEQLRHQLHEAESDRQVGVILIDLDGFKEVNDSLGHHNGDELLRIVAQRFQRCVGARSAIARLGGDEFAGSCLVVSRDMLVTIAYELVSTLADPVSLEGVAVRVGASIGVSLSPDDGLTHTDLLRTADVAMYEAKRTQSVVCSYHAEHDLNTRERLELIDDLRTAIDGRALTLHFQPTLAMRSADVYGVEALVRWHHPTRGMLYPDTFIPLAERVGLIPQLTRAVLEIAVAESGRLEREGHSLQMSVNISRYDLIDEHLPAYIDEVLARFDVPHNRVTLEITESCLSEEPERVKRQIEELRSRGLRISIDDFGVGYSSLSQLLELPIDELKIDKSFVQALETDTRAEAIVRSTIELGRALSLRITAEGMENLDTLLHLRRLGADVAQGYHISRPLTSSQLDEFLNRPSHEHHVMPALAALPVAAEAAVLQSGRGDLNPRP